MTKKSLDDIEEALKVDFINEKYGAKLALILNYDIFINASMVKSVADSIIKSLKKT